MASDAYCASFTNLAWVLWQTGRDGESEAGLDAGLAAMGAASEKGDPTFLHALDKVASACRNQGNLEAARKHFGALHALLNETFGPADPRTAAAAHEVERLSGDWQKGSTRLQ